MSRKTVEAGSLENVAVEGEIVGFRFGVRLPRYRGNFVSLINGFYVMVDGVEYPQSKLKFEINGKAPRTFEEIKTAVWESWNYQDTGYLHVEKPGGLEKGSHEIISVISNFEQYGYIPGEDEKRVNEVTIPDSNPFDPFAPPGPPAPYTLELK